MSCFRYASWSVGLLVVASAPAFAQSSAVVTGDRVNLRSRPSVLQGEPFGQLERGQRVLVVEEGLPPSNPKDSVAEWSRVEVPDSIPVWVAAGHVELPAGTVRPKRLNVRAGPSEDHGVLGTVPSEAIVRVLGETNGWLQIAAPTGLSAFVASRFLDPVAADTVQSASGVSVQSPPPVRGPASETPPPTTTGEAPRETAAPEPDIESAAPAPPLSSAPASSPATEPAAPPLPGVPAGSAPDATAASPAKRIIRREGVVRATLSFQAPTSYELAAADTGKLLNYLSPESPSVSIRTFRGHRVLVVGEEYVVPRWQEAPVILVREIKLAP